MQRNQSYIVFYIAPRFLIGTAYIPIFRSSEGLFCSGEDLSKTLGSFFARHPVYVRN